MVESSISIFRKPTYNEKQDFVEVGSKNYLDRFLAVLANKQQEYLKKFTPFCTHCAKVDFEKKVKDIAEEAQYGNLDDNSKLLDSNLLDKYANRDRWEFIKSDDVREDKLLDGIRQTVITGKKYYFKCTARGCGYTVFVPGEQVAMIDAWIANNKEVKETSSKTK